MQVIIVCESSSCELQDRINEFLVHYEDTDIVDIKYCTWDEPYSYRKHSAMIMVKGKINNERTFKEV